MLNSFYRRGKEVKQMWNVLGWSPFMRGVDSYAHIKQTSFRGLWRPWCRHPSGERYSSGMRGWEAAWILYQRSLSSAHMLLWRTGQHLSLFLLPLAHSSSQQIKFITASNYNYSLEGLHNETINENDKWKRHTTATLDPQWERGEKPFNET